jgi:hypothetical protein
MKDCEVEMAALATQMECGNVYCMSGELAMATDLDRANVGVERCPRTVKVGRTMAQLSPPWEVSADVRGLRAHCCAAPDRIRPAHPSQRLKDQREESPQGGVENFPAPEMVVVESCDQIHRVLPCETTGTRSGGMRVLHVEEPRGQTRPSHPKMRSEIHHAGILENDDQNWRVPEDSDSLQVLEAVHMNLEFAVAQHGSLSLP